MEDCGGVGGRRILAEAAAEEEFDTNMVIILAALLVALICALGLNSIVRWCTAPEEVTGGVKKRELRRIQVASYGEAPEISGSDCAICLADFAEGERLRVLPTCNHGFHVACIDRWLSSNPSCPICRHSLATKA